MIKLLNSQYFSFTTPNNGAVLKTESGGDLLISFCNFISCKATGTQSYGGAIFVDHKQNSFVLKNTCASECNSYYGFVLHASVAKIFANEVATTKSSGTYKSSLVMISVNDVIKNYNGSYDSPTYDSNVWIQNAQYIQAKYHNYYENKNDALFVLVNGKDNFYLSNSNIISNTHSRGFWGYIHLNAAEATLITCDLIFKDNEDAHALFDCYSGIIHAERIICNKYVSNATLSNKYCINN